MAQLKRLRLERFFLRPLEPSSEEIWRFPFRSGEGSLGLETPVGREEEREADEEAVAAGAREGSRERRMASWISISSGLYDWAK